MTRHRPNSIYATTAFFHIFPNSLITLTLTLGAILLQLLIFFLCGAAAQRRLWPPHSRGFRDHTHDAPLSVELLWTSDQSVAETST
jgi:hypothetical protein